MAAKPKLKQLDQSGATDGQHILWNNTAGTWEAATPAAEGVPQQEELTAEAITGDTALTDTLAATPTSNASLKLTLNGILQNQGAGNDYTVSGQTITWLAGTGTAVDMEASDTLVAFYEA